MPLGTGLRGTCGMVARREPGRHDEYRVRKAGGRPSPGGSGRLHLEELATVITGEAVNVVAQRAGAPPSPEMLVSGNIPPLADFYLQRLETGIDLKASLFPGETVVLTHGEETETALAAQGGTGKTQLAVEFTHALRNARAADVLVWVSAASREAVVTGFAQAASAVGAGDPDADALAAAGRFAAWLARTERRWALVLDDLADVADLDGLSPPARTARSSSRPGCPARPSASARTRRPAACGSPRWAGSAAGRPCPTSVPGSPTTPTSGSRFSISPRTSTPCRSAWPRRSR